MIEKEKLESYAKKLMFQMKDEEYETLQKEFEIIIKQMDLIGEIKDLSKVKPLSFPHTKANPKLAKDEVNENDMLTVDEVLANSKSVLKDQVKVPKVVE